MLYALTRELSSTHEPRQIAAVAARYAAEVFEAKALVLNVANDGTLHVLGAAPEEAVLDGNDLGVAKWSVEHDELAGLGTDTLPGSPALCVPLRAGPSRLGVLALLPSTKQVLRAEQRAFLDVLSRQVCDGAGAGAPGRRRKTGCIASKNGGNALLSPLGRLA